MVEIVASNVEFVESNVIFSERNVDLQESIVDSGESFVEFQASIGDLQEIIVDQQERTVEFWLDIACWKWGMKGMETVDDEREGPELGDLAFALSQPVRWRMLELLSGGEALAVKDVARSLGLQVTTASKHMIILRKAGLAVQGAGRLYALPPGMKPEPGSRDLKLGRCTLHFQEEGYGCNPSAAYEFPEKDGYS